MRAANLSKRWSAYMDRVFFVWKNYGFGLPALIDYEKWDKFLTMKLYNETVQSDCGLNVCKRVVQSMPRSKTQFVLFLLSQWCYNIYSFT